MEVRLCFSERLKADQTYDLAMPLQNIFPKDSCVNPLTIATNRIKHKCPSTDEWVTKKVEHIHNGILYPYKDKNGISEK